MRPRPRGGAAAPSPSPGPAAPPLGLRPLTSASSRVTSSRSSTRARASASRTRLSSWRAVIGGPPDMGAALSARSCR